MLCLKILNLGKLKKCAPLNEITDNVYQSVNWLCWQNGFRLTSNNNFSGHCVIEGQLLQLIFIWNDNQVGDAAGYDLVVVLATQVIGEQNQNWNLVALQIPENFFLT